MPLLLWCIIVYMILAHIYYKSALVNGAVSVLIAVTIKLGSAANKHASLKERIVNLW